MDKSHIPLSLRTHLPVPGLGIINHPVLPTSDCKGNKVPTTQPGPHPRQPGGSSSYSSTPSLIYIILYIPLGFPSGSDGKESACNVRDPGSIPWVGKIPWSRAWQPTPVFLPGEFHGQRSLAGYSPWGHKGSDMTGHLTPSLIYIYYILYTYTHTFYEPWLALLGPSAWRSAADMWGGLAQPLWSLLSFPFLKSDH